MNTDILSRSGFSLDRLAGFCAVAGAGSIVGAARGDVTRQSLLSRQIRELEEFFGAELVRRHGRGLVLTDAGRQLAALGRSQISALGDFAAACRGTRVTVSLVASETLLQWLILPRLAPLRAASPQADFTVFHEDNAAIAARVREGVFDFGFLRRKPQRGEAGIAELGNLDYLLAAPRALVRGRDWTLAEALAKLPLAVPEGGSMRESLAAFVQRQGAALAPALGCTSYLHAAAALRSGACAAVLPTLAMSEFTADRFFTWPLTPLKLERDPISVIWNQRNAAIRPAVATLAAAMPDTFHSKRMPSFRLPVEPDLRERLKGNSILWLWRPTTSPFRRQHCPTVITVCRADVAFLTFASDRAHEIPHVPQRAGPIASRRAR